MKKTLKYIGFWLVQCTWGIVMTLIGALVTLVLIIAGKKPKHLGPVVYTEVGKYWGGLELGGFFLVCENSGSHTKLHEAGHGLQNMIWGPLFPFVVAIPSATRYWLRNCTGQINKSMFAFVYMLVTLVVTTGIICLAQFVLNWAWLVYVAEAFRAYFLCVTIWMAAFEIPKYDQKTPYYYDDIWFEGQATRWGEKHFTKYIQK